MKNKLDINLWSIPLFIFISSDLIVKVLFMLSHKNAITTLYFVILLSILFIVTVLGYLASLNSNNKFIFIDDSLKKLQDLIYSKLSRNITIGMLIIGIYFKGIYNTIYFICMYIFIYFILYIYKKLN